MIIVYEIGDSDKTQEPTFNVEADTADEGIVRINNVIANRDEISQLVDGLDLILSLTRRSSIATSNIG